MTKLSPLAQKISPPDRRVISQVLQCRFPDDPKEAISRLADTILKREDSNLPSHTWTHRWIEMDRKNNSLEESCVLSEKHRKFLLTSVRYQGEAIIILWSRIGGGTYKRVWKGVFLAKEFQREVAYLETRPHLWNSFDWNSNEMTYLRRLEQKPIPGIIPVLSVQGIPERPAPGVSGTRFSSIQPLYEGDLQSFIAEHPQLPRQQRRNLEYQMLRSLYELHRRGIVHRDVKPGNFLVRTFLPGSDPNDPKTLVTVALGDLAFAVHFKKDLPESPCGSRLYMSPEYVWLMYCKDQGIKQESIGSWTTPALDMWGLGLIFAYIENRALYDQIISYCDEDSKNIALWERKRLVRYTFYCREGQIPEFQEPKHQGSIDHLIWRMLQACFWKRISSEQALAELARIQMEEEDPTCVGSDDASGFSMEKEKNCTVS